MLTPPDEPTYFMRAKGKIFGPFSQEQMLTLRRRGQLSRVHEVSSDRESWRPAATFPEFFSEATQGILITNGLVTEVMPSVNSPISPGMPTGLTPPENQKGADWHYSIDGRQYGPVTLEELKRLVKEEEVLGEDLVWTGSMSEWAPCRDVRELQPRKKKKAESPSKGRSGDERFLQSANHAFCSACGSPVHIRAEVCPECGVRQKQVTGERNRMNAALLALFLGGLGVHRFYLGQPFVGLIYLLFCWTFIPAIVAFVEGIVFLCQSDQSFNRTYNE